MNFKKKIKPFSRNSNLNVSKKIRYSKMLRLTVQNNYFHVTVYSLTFRLVFSFSVERIEFSLAQLATSVRHKEAQAFRPIRRLP